MSIGILKARLGTLDAPTADKALWFLAACADDGIALRITQAHRSSQEQACIYAQGRVDLAQVNALRQALQWPDLKEYENKIVTQAGPGESWHNFHRAFDVVPMQSGVPNWESLAWSRIGELGEAVGLEWGGRWSHPDKPHFQNTQGITLAQARALHIDDA